MNMRVTAHLSGQVNQTEPTSENCYEIYRKNTDKYVEYNVFEHMGHNVKRSEFLRDVDALAAYFSGFMKRGDTFSCFMPTNIESLVIFYALNKIGVTLSFIHPLLPENQFRNLLSATSSKGVAVTDKISAENIEIIKNAGITCIVCTKATYASDNRYEVSPDIAALSYIKEKIPSAVTYNGVIEKYKDITVDGLQGNSGDIALMMAGGGTTGKSRIIKLSSYAVNSLCYMLAGNCEPVKQPGIQTVLGVMPFFHAYGLCSGGICEMQKGYKLVLMESFNPDEFVRQMKANTVIGFNGVPNMYRKLLATPGFDSEAIGNLTHLSVGADDVSPSLTAAYDELLKKYGSPAKLMPGYGLTECCAACSCNTKWAYRQGSIGKPLSGNTIEIWNEDKHRVPAGQTGEIVISGPSMMSGYLNDEGRENDGLYTDENGRQWVLTGDLGRMDEEGFLFFVGRKKRVIIISGYNVYPGDIEKQLTELDFIRECCPVQGIVNGKPIVRVFAVLNETADKEKLEEYKNIMTEKCRKNLFKFAVPRDIVFIKALPRTLVQKVDFMKLTQSADEKAG